MKKWISSLNLLMILAMSAAHASTTKVGNGDDGRDLEGTQPITSGVIFETRAQAVANLKALNVQGIAGLGFLIPEVENTKLLLARMDVRPIKSDGDWEASPDREKAYARTFAEPHAPTRFFPAALKLSREQLIALHTHEALHRALPAGVREDEEKVSLLTIALTSPSANFDRVNRIAQRTLADDASPLVNTSTLARLPPESVPDLPQRKSFVEARHYTFGGRLSPMYSVERFGGEFSLFDSFHLRGFAAEPRLKTEALIMTTGQGGSMGPLNFVGHLALSKDLSKEFGPVARFSTRAVEGGPYLHRAAERDVYSIGAYYRSRQSRSYRDYAVSYTLPDSFTQRRVNDPIWTIDLTHGLFLGRMQIGGRVAAHHSVGSRDWRSFTLLELGPELKWTTGRWTLIGGGSILATRTTRSLDQLQDIAGHGGGKAHFSAGLQYSL